MTELLYKDLGCLDYLASLTLQERILQRKQHGALGDVLLFVQHPHIYTLGRGGKSSNVLAALGVPVIRTSRGGDVTYHGPGQMVAYPLVDLRSRLRKDVHRYLSNLELSTVRTLKDFDLEATRRPPYTGVWIGDKKIAAIGIAVRRSITYHGLALNVKVDLSYFKRIVPCGLTWADVTSMEKELGKAPPMMDVRETFLHRFAGIFGYQEIRESQELLDIQLVPSGCSEAARSSTIGTSETV